MFCNIFSLASGVTLFHCCCRYSSASLSLSVFLLSGGVFRRQRPGWMLFPAVLERLPKLELPLLLPLFGGFVFPLLVLQPPFPEVVCRCLQHPFPGSLSQECYTMPASLCSTQFSRKTSTIGGVAVPSSSKCRMSLLPSSRRGRG